MNIAREGLGVKNENDTKGTKPARLPVAKDVARLAGVSIATVSRALNGSEKIRPETRTAVLKAASDLGFVVNNAARALSTRRSYAVGAIVPSLSNEVFVRALSSFQKILRQSGYQTIVASTDYDIEVESREAHFLMSNGVDGLMLVGGIHDSSLYERARQGNIPIVQSFSLSDDRCCVGFDNREATLKATRYLLDLGHQVLAVITGTRANNDRAEPRAEGVRQALAERGLKLDPENDIIVSSGIVAGRDAVRQLISKSGILHPTAIICGTDEIALGVISEATERGILVPQMLSVIGFNDSNFASVVSPPLTTIRVDADRIGQLSGVAMLDLLQGHNTVQVTRVTPELVLRGTTAQPFSRQG